VTALRQRDFRSVIRDGDLPLLQGAAAGGRSAERPSAVRRALRHLRETTFSQQSDAASLIRRFALPAARARDQGTGARRGAGRGVPAETTPAAPAARDLAAVSDRNRGGNDAAGGRSIARGGDQGHTALGAVSLGAARHREFDALNNSIGVDFGCGHMTSCSPRHGPWRLGRHRAHARRGMTREPKTVSSGGARLAGGEKPRHFG